MAHRYSARSHTLRALYPLDLEEFIMNKIYTATTNWVPDKLQPNHQLQLSWYIEIPIICTHTFCLT